MVEGLKSTIRRIHWSLLLRASVFAVAWYVLPAWLFCLAGLLLYFFPAFQWSKFLAPFIGLLVLGFVQPQSFWFLFVYAGLFIWLFLIRDLLFIDRRSAYEILVIAVSFFLIRDVYSVASLAHAFAIPFLFLAALIGWMVGSLSRAFGEESGRERGLIRASLWISIILMWQIFLVAAFLPLDFVYQSTIAFLFLVLIIDFVPAYFQPGFSRDKILIPASVVFSALILVLASARWGL